MLTQDAAKRQKVIHQAVVAPFALDVLQDRSQEMRSDETDKNVRILQHISPLVDTDLFTDEEVVAKYGEIDAFYAFDEMTIQEVGHIAVVLICYRTCFLCERETVCGFNILRELYQALCDRRKDNLLLEIVFAMRGMKMARCFSHLSLAIHVYVYQIFLKDTSPKSTSQRFVFRNFELLEKSVKTIEKYVVTQSMITTCHYLFFFNQKVIHRDINWLITCIETAKTVGVFNKYNANIKLLPILFSACVRLTESITTSPLFDFIIAATCATMCTRRHFFSCGSHSYKFNTFLSSRTNDGLLMMGIEKFYTNHQSVARFKMLRDNAIQVACKNTTGVPEEFDRRVLSNLNELIGMINDINVFFTVSDISSSRKNLTSVNKVIRDNITLDWSRLFNGVPVFVASKKQWADNKKIDYTKPRENFFFMCEAGYDISDNVRKNDVIGVMGPFSLDDKNSEQCTDPLVFYFHNDMQRRNKFPFIDPVEFLEFVEIPDIDDTFHILSDASTPAQFLASRTLFNSIPKRGMLNKHFWMIIGGSSLVDYRLKTWNIVPAMSSTVRYFYEINENSKLILIGDNLADMNSYQIVKYAHREKTKLYRRIIKKIIYKILFSLIVGSRVYLYLQNIAVSITGDGNINVIFTKLFKKVDPLISFTYSRTMKYKNHIPKLLMDGRSDMIARNLDRLNNQSIPFIKQIFEEIMYKTPYAEIDLSYLEKHKLKKEMDKLYIYTRSTQRAKKDANSRFLFPAIPTTATHNINIANHIICPLFYIGSKCLNLDENIFMVFPKTDCELRINTMLFATFTKIYAEGCKWFWSITHNSSILKDYAPNAHSQSYLPCPREYEWHLPSDFYMGWMLKEDHIDRTIDLIEYWLTVFKREKKYLADIVTQRKKEKDRFVFHFAHEFSTDLIPKYIESCTCFVHALKAAKAGDFWEIGELFYGKNFLDIYISNVNVLIREICVAISDHKSTKDNKRS